MTVEMSLVPIALIGKIFMTHSIIIMCKREWDVE